MNTISNFYSTNVMIEPNPIEWLKIQPDIPKEKLGMFNFWNEQKRKEYSDDAVCSKLVLDYDNGVFSSDVAQSFGDISYIFYHSSSNTPELEKFRIILDLKEPVDAYTLKYWRTNSKFLSFFNGVDPSTFAVGRFFYRPSAKDKAGNAVNICIHNGNPLDFYSLFSKKTQNKAFDDIVRKMKQSQINHQLNTDRCFIDAFRSWIDKKGGLHYPDICAVVLRAQSCGVSLDDAMTMFEERYEGSSNWKKNFEKFWYNHT